MFRKILLILAFTLSFPTTSLPLIRYPWALSKTQYQHAQLKECQRGSVFLNSLYNPAPKNFLNTYITPLLNTLNNRYITLAVVTGVVIYAWRKRKEAQKAQEGLKAFKLDHTIRN